MLLVLGRTPSRSSEALAGFASLFHQLIPEKAAVTWWRIYAGGVTGGCGWASCPRALRTRPKPRWEVPVSEVLLLHLYMTSHLPALAFSSCPFSPPPFFFSFYI